MHKYPNYFILPVFMLKDCFSCSQLPSETQVNQVLLSPAGDEVHSSSWWCVPQHSQRADCGDVWLTRGVVSPYSCSLSGRILHCRWVTTSCEYLSRHHTLFSPLVTLLYRILAFYRNLPANAILLPKTNNLLTNKTFWSIFSATFSMLSVNILVSKTDFSDIFPSWLVSCI